MSDQCKHCVYHGDLPGCSSGECRHHDNWYAQKLREIIRARQEDVKRLRDALVLCVPEVIWLARQLKSVQPKTIVSSSVTNAINAAAEAIAGGKAEKVGDHIAGCFELGTDGNGHVVINYGMPPVDENGNGYFAFSCRQARVLTESLIRLTEYAEAEEAALASAGEGEGK